MDEQMTIERVMLDKVTDHPVRSAVAHDGDSITLQIYAVFKLITEPEIFRLIGIDAPELDIPEQAAAAKHARDVAQGWIAAMVHPRAIVDGGHLDKYGRPMVRLYDKANPAVTLNDKMLANKLARPFDGQSAKPPWSQAELDLILNFK